MNKQITLAIAEKLAQGMDIVTAYDAVLGSGAYVKMAGRIYDAMKAA